MLLKVRNWDKKSVGMPGIVSGLPMSRYHAANACIEPSISSSGLRTIFLDSPKHYFAFSPYNPKRWDKDENTALTVGRAAHHLLFGLEGFRKEFAVTPETLDGADFSLRRKVCKVWWEDRIGEGLTPIKLADFDHIKGMAESLIEEPLVQAGILNGLIEHSWFWKDEETGIWLKIRPDATPNESLDFADLKTTTSVAWPALQRAIRDHGYFQQAGLVAEVARNVLGQPINSFTLVFVEKQPPYCTAIVTLKGSDIARGIRANRYAIRKFAEGLKTGKWLGPAGDMRDAQYIELPEHDQKRIDERLQLEGV